MNKTMTIEALIDQYCLGWSDPQASERARLIRASLTDEATYCDPRADRLGIEALLDHIARVHVTRPGARVVRTSRVDAHHGLARFHWRVEMPDGTALPEGIDFVELSADGTKLARIVGFFGPLSP
jgi:hypothetical protein